MQPITGRGRQQQPARALSKSIPPPRPLSARARAFVAQVNAQEAERRQAVDRAFALGMRLAKADAKTSDQVAVYDENGNLCGTVDPDAIIPVTSAAASAADGTTPAPTAKAMSLGARGQHQLGGKTPRGGVPVVPADEADDEELTKALQQVQAAAPLLKARLTNAATATERNAAFDALNAAATVAMRQAFEHGRRR